LEASGVTVNGDHLFVVFDNHAKAAQIHQSIAPDGDPCWLEKDEAFEGFEDITYSPHRDCLFALIEAVRTAEGAHHAEVVEYDALPPASSIPAALCFGNRD
jgi:hypothetical protein